MNNNKANAFARNVLMFYDTLSYEEPIQYPSFLKSGSIIPILAQRPAERNSLTVYPNPAKDYIIVELMTGNVSGAIIRLFDNQGRPVRTVEMPAKQQHYVLQVKDLQTGIYYLKVEQNGKTLESKKFSKMN